MDRPALVTRPATRDDGAFLRKLHRAALGPSVEATWGPWDDVLQQRFHDELMRDLSGTFIVTLDSIAVGMKRVVSTGRTVSLARLELLPEVQGRGIGSRLIRGVIDDAFAAGRDVELDVLAANPRARRLYERMGFSVVGRDDVRLHMRLANRNRR